MIGKKEEERKEGRREGGHHVGITHPTDCFWMQKDAVFLQGFFRALFDWALVSSFLIEFYLFRREQKKYCLTGPAPPPCSSEEGERPGAISRRASSFQACVNKLW